MVDRATVRRNLIGISAGGMFKFRHAAGALAKVKSGKVMLLQGADALIVTSVRRSHGGLLIRTKPAQLTDVISSGRIKFSGAPDFRKAILSKVVVPSSAHVSADFVRPAYPYVGSPSSLRASAAGSPAFSAQGRSGLYGYLLTFTPVSPTRLDVSGTVCFLTSGSNYGTGGQLGLSADIKLTGYIDAGNASGGVTVNGGFVTNSSFSLMHLAAHAHITYTVARGEGAVGNADPPVFRLPIALDYTIPGEIPFYLKVQGAVLLKLGVSSKNAVIHGGVDVNTAGSDTITQQGSSVSSSQTGDTVHGKVLDQSDGGVAPSISAAPSGTVVAVQFPKLGVGLGFTSANGIAYVDLVTSIGQTTGAAVAGMFCSSFDVKVTIGDGLEAQVGIGKFRLKLATPRHLLFDPPLFQTHDPGCPQT